ncbi:MAG: hypothetical protein ACOCTR_05155 [Candidatus Natronoplasma sp.]
MKKLKKIDLRACLVGFTVLLILGMTILSGTNSAAGASANAPTWSEGDQWSYKRNTSSSEYPYVFTVTVNSTSTTMNGHECYKITQKSDIVVNWHKYMTKDDLKLVKTENVDAYDRTYESPVNQYNFPLEVGDEWQINVTYTYGEDEYNLKRNYTCLRKETVSVPAGDYEAYVIKSYEYSKWVDPDTDYKLTYYSPEVKYKVKEVKYVEEGDDTGEKKISQSTNLTSYQVGGVNGEGDGGEDTTGEGDEDSTPGFSIGIVVTAIATGALITEWKKNIHTGKRNGEESR